jgi:hypothetical protein
MDGATPAHLKEMYRIIKYVLTTKTKGLKMNPKFEKEGTPEYMGFASAKR